jgi:hypothetical protein
MRYLVIFTLIVISASIFAIDFYDDFEGYDIGDDITISTDWDWDMDGGHFYIIDDGGDKVVESDFDGYITEYIGYNCLGAGDNCLDVAIDMDFKYDGEECYFALVARGQYDTEEGYVGGLYFYNSSYTFVGVNYMDMYGTEIPLFYDVAPTVSPNTWHNLKFVVGGNDPVEFEVYLDYSLIAECSDDTYLVGAGTTGFGCFYDNLEPTLWADDYNVDDDHNINIKTTSIGSIKSLFY